MSSYPSIEVDLDGLYRITRGHRWIFANQIVSSMSQLPVGEVVRVRNRRDETVGFAHSNPHSLLALRMLSISEEPDVNWLHRTLAKAAAYRNELYSSRAGCMLSPLVHRLVHAEADSLPGLIIDRYDRHFVVQIMTAGMNNWKSLIIEWLKSTYECESITVHYDQTFRDREFLPEFSENLIGESPERFWWQDDSVWNAANLKSGQKTGSYLDQRWNRLWIGSTGQVKVVLDLFAHHGSFGIRAAVKGAVEVILVESSEAAIGLSKEVAEKNGVLAKCQFVAQDVNEFLKQSNRSFDLVICDPPSLVRNRASISSGARAYSSVYRKAMQKVASDGYFIPFSCSQLFTPAHFYETLFDSNRNRDWHVIEMLKQAPDHPFVLNHPESMYLKGVIMQARAS